MTVHIDPLTGQPLFIMDQIMMIEVFREIYKEFGIHGIYYCVFFGWSASPYASITNIEEKHALVSEEVNDSKYYDPVTKTDERRSKRAVPCPLPPRPLVEGSNGKPIPKSEREKKEDERIAMIIKGCNRVNKLARVPVLESKIQYMAIIDRIWDGLKQPFDGRDLAKAKDGAALQKVLLSNRKDAENNLEDVLRQEREILTKADTMASLNDFWLS